MIVVGFLVTSLKDERIASDILRLARENELVLNNKTIILCKNGVSGINKKNVKKKISAFTIHTFNTPDDIKTLTLVHGIKCIYQIVGLGEVKIDVKDLAVHIIEDSYKERRRIESFDKAVVQYAIRNPISYGLTYTNKNNGKNITAIFATPIRPPIVPLIQVIMPPNVKEDSVPVKKANIRIRMLCNWTSSEQLCSDWNKMSNGDCKWGKIEFVPDNTYIDYYVIINKPPDNCVKGVDYIADRTIVYRMEPYIETSDYYNNWLGPLKTSHFMYFLEHEHFRNNTEWWLNKTIKELNTESIGKNSDNRISAIVSPQYTMPGHKLRIDIIKYLQENSTLSLDIYGYDNSWNFKNYKGPLPTRSKEQGLFPYKYTLAAENSDIKNYFTEKITDAILSETLCFYWGCSNIEEFIDPRAYIRLPMDDKAKSMSIIENAIKHDEWSKRINIIKKEKHKIVNHFGFFARTCTLLDIRNNVDFIHIPYFKSPVDIPGIKYTMESLDINISSSSLSEPFRNYTSNSISTSSISRLVVHSNIWTKHANSKIACVLEGTARNNFCDHMCTLLSAIHDIEWDIIFLSWNSPSTVDREFLQPFIPFYHKNMNKCGKISHSYLIHPKFSAYLQTFINMYGFILQLEDFLIYIQTFVPGIKSYLWNTNLVDANTIDENKNELHLFRALPTGKLTNIPVPLKFPPSSHSKIHFMTSDMFVKYRQSNQVVLE